MNKKRLYLWERRLRSANPQRFFAPGTTFDMTDWVGNFGTVPTEWLALPSESRGPVPRPCYTAACFSGELYLLGEVPEIGAAALADYFDISPRDARFITSSGYDSLEDATPAHVASVLRAVRLGLYDHDASLLIATHYVDGALI